MADDRSRRKLTVWEKLAVGIIVSLLIVIVLLIFVEEIQDYLNVFFNWYSSGIYQGLKVFCPDNLWICS